MTYKDDIQTILSLFAGNKEGLFEIISNEIESDEQLTTVLYNGYKGCVERMEYIKSCENYSVSADAQDTFEILNHNKDIYNFYGCLAINEMEFYAAIRNMLRSESYWDYSVSVRRAYTLIHEIKLNMSKLFGNNGWTRLTRALHEDERKNLGRIKSEIENFHKRDKIGLAIEETRNKTEAHKDPDFILQVELIEAISAKESWDIIFAFSDIFKRLMSAVTFILNALERDIQEFCKEHPSESNQ